jgi:GT2 family glycosyltransferase
MATSIALVTECDVAEGIPSITVPSAGGRALVLVRIFTEPLGMVTAMIPGDGLSPVDLARVIVRELGAQLRERFVECGLDWKGELPIDGLHPQRTPRFLASRERVMREGPLMTVAVCTRDRPESLAATLNTLCAQEYQLAHILVVDNAPSDNRTREIVQTAADEHDFDIDYVIESRPGLSWARNRAIEASGTEVIAFVDDDERCDRWWAAELARGFVEVPQAGAVTGVVIPGELVTESQALFEKFFGIRVGRGFARAVFSPATACHQSPLYPRPPFGAGGNMAFRRDALNRIGRFDCALGAGTMTKGCEDTAALSALLLEGGTIVYQPTAIAHHYYGRDYAALRRQLQGYGRGLTSFYTSMLLRRPSCIFEMLRLSGRAARDQFSDRGRRHGGLGEDFPRDLLRANFVGRLQGPFMYVAARLQAQRLRRAMPGR